MELRNKLTMCRLCLGENECFINVFELNDLQGFIAAEVITDLLQFVVSETDGYPHVVCSKCLMKLTEFKLFKECCQESKVKYDDVFVSSKMIEEHEPQTLEFVTVKTEPIFSSDNVDNVSKAIVKPEEVIINSSPDEASKDPFEETETVVSCGPILLKHEVLPFSRESHTQDEATEPWTSDYSSATADPTSANAEGNSSDMISSEITIKEEPLEEFGFNSSELCIEDPLGEVSYDCLEHGGHHSASRVVDGGEISNREISINDESILEKSITISLSEEVKASSSGIMERFKEQWNPPEERMCMAPLFQRDMDTRKEEMERQREEKEMECVGEEGREAAPENKVEGKKAELQCHHCGSYLMTKLGLVQHMRVHGFGNSHDCNVCGKIFRMKWDLNRHVLTHTGAKPYKCTKCSKCFTRKCQLNKHMISHTDSKPFKCAMCSKCFSQTQNLKEHVRTHTDLKTYKCLECSKSFCYNIHLQTHMKTHTGSKPYKCAACSKGFSLSEYLKAHMKTHLGLKPHKCLECGKCFGFNGHLTTHMRTHTGSKPYKCEECSKSFSRSQHLKEHKVTHMSIKPYKCSDCHKSFSHNRYLKAHMRTHISSKQ